MSCRFDCVHNINNYTLQECHNFLPRITGFYQRIEEGKCIRPQVESYNGFEVAITANIGAVEYAMKLYGASESTMAAQYTHKPHSLKFHSSQNPDECLDIDEASFHIVFKACASTSTQLWRIAPNSGKLVSMHNGYCANGYDDSDFLKYGNCPDGASLSWELDADGNFIETNSGKYLKKDSSGKVSLVSQGSSPTKMYWQTNPFLIKSLQLNENANWLQLCLDLKHENALSDVIPPSFRATLEQCESTSSQLFYMTSDGQIRFNGGGHVFCMYTYHSGGASVPYVIFAICGSRDEHRYYETAEGKISDAGGISGLTEAHCMDAEGGGSVSFRKCSLTPNGYNDQLFMLMPPPAYIRSRANIDGPDIHDHSCFHSPLGYFTMSSCRENIKKFFVSEYSQLRSAMYPEQCPTYLPNENRFEYQQCDPDNNLQKFLYNAKLSHFTIAGLPGQCLTYDIWAADKGSSLILSECEHNYIYQQFTIG